MSFTTEDKIKIIDKYSSSLIAISKATGIDLEVLRRLNKDAIIDHPAIASHLMPFPLLPVLSPKELAERLNMKVNTLTVWRRTKANQLPFSKNMAGRIEYRTIDVLNFEIKYLMSGAAK